MDTLANYQSVIGTLPSGLMKSYRRRLELDLDFISKSKYMKQVDAELEIYAAEKKPITVVGPVGNGRRTLARAIHLSSSDWWRPFIEADLTGMSEERALKHLFGYKEGKLFSSTESKEGLISAASMSTLCLKNFDAYPRKVQREVYKLYSRREYHPLSSQDRKPLECRLVFTVQIEPGDLLKTGYVDENIYKMLAQRIVTIPPLSKRKDDIVPLAEKFIQDWCAGFGLPIKKLSKDAERWLKKAPWNGNVNQLKKVVFFACMNTRDGELYPDHFALAHEGNIDRYQKKQLDELSIQSLIEAKLESFMRRLGRFEATHLYEAIISRVEEPLLRLVLSYAGGNQIKASRMLGINRNTLRAKLTKYKIKVTKGGKVR